MRDYCNNLSIEVSKPYAGVSYGTTTDYSTSNVKKIVEAWAKDKFSNELKEDDTGYSARVMTYDEYTDNCDYILPNPTSSYIYVPKFDFMKGLHTWIMTPASVDGMKVESTTGETGILAWAVSGYGFIEKAEIVRKSYGIRPVVTFKKINSSDETTNIVKVDDTFLKPVIWIVILGIIIIVGIIISTILFIKFNKNNQE